MPPPALIVINYKKTLRICGKIQILPVLDPDESALMAVAKLLILLNLKPQNFFLCLIKQLKLKQNDPNPGLEIPISKLNLNTFPGERSLKLNLPLLIVILLRQGD